MAVAAEVASADPAALAAETTTRSVRPTSSGVAAYVAAVAPAIGAQLAAEASQRSHWCENVSGGVPFQEPSSAVSVEPSRGVPETLGAVVAAGAAGSTDAGAEVALAVPPAMSTQLAPVRSQRSHW